jgi:hypothetical protein
MTLPYLYDIKATDLVAHSGFLTPKMRAMFGHPFPGNHAQISNHPVFTCSRSLTYMTDCLYRRLFTFYYSCKLCAAELHHI